MYYFIKSTKFDYGDLNFNPSAESYRGFVTAIPPQKGTTVTMQLRSPLTRKFNADYVSANKGDLCSLKLRKILEEENSGILFYETQVFDRKGKPIEDKYYLMHISDRFNCVDYDLSIYKHENLSISCDYKNYDPLTSFDFVKLNEKFIGESRCFYALNAPFSYMPIVCEEIAKKLISFKLKGIAIMPASEFKWSEITGGSTS